jgi:hypothetical protein
MYAREGQEKVLHKWNLVLTKHFQAHGGGAHPLEM